MTMDSDTLPIPESTSSEETEAQLIARAQTALSQCRWTVGECASAWTTRYARGRTDADFANLVGLTADQVYQRRRVWESFAALRPEFPTLKWSHFYSALAWDDALECLQWAASNEATVAEMKAWRRVQRGEDLLEQPPFATDDSSIIYMPSEPTQVLDPDGFRSGVSGGSRPTSASANEELMMGVARQFEPDSGFSSEQTSFGSAPVATEPRPEPSTEQLVRRMTSQLERMLKIFTPEFVREFRKIPKPVRMHFLKCAEEIGLRSGDLG